MSRINLKEWMASQQRTHHCQCGCGQSIRIIKEHHTRGIPRFLKSHSSRVCNPMSGRFGAANPHYKGGQYINSRGYVVVLNGGRSSRRYALEHRLVMEAHLGRRLRKDEQVHHINGIKTDNRLENLQILSATEHAQLHEEQLRNAVGESRYLAAKRNINKGLPYREALQCSR